MKTLEPVKDNDLSVQLTIMQGQLDTILSELHALRRERLPSSPELIENLLAALFVIFNDAEFTSAWVLETCIENDPDAAKLLQSITAAIEGTRPSIKKLSRFLNKTMGAHGGYRLEVANPHGRDGTTFIVRVTK